jgi:hypothetical protein
MRIEELLTLQEQGAKACREGIQEYENPFLDVELMPLPREAGWGDWVAKHDAWKFGWAAENAAVEGKLAFFCFRHPTSARKRM